MPIVKHVKCGICLTFYGAFRFQCPYCGTFKIITEGKRTYYTNDNNHITEIVRGIPLPMSAIIDRVINIAARVDDLANKSINKEQRPLVGKTKHGIRYTYTLEAGEIEVK